MNRFLVWEHTHLPKAARRLRSTVMLAVAALLPVVDRSVAAAAEYHDGAGFVCSHHPEAGLLCARCAVEHERAHTPVCAACDGMISSAVLAPSRHVGVALGPCTIRVARAGGIVSEPRELIIVAELHDVCMQHLFALFAAERARPSDPPEGETA